jgi:hypothetical protein
MLLRDRDPEPPADDLRQARELALLICRSEEAIETFVAHCVIAARDLLMPYGDVVMGLSIVLRIKRTLDGCRDRCFYFRKRAKLLSSNVIAAPIGANASWQPKCFEAEAHHADAATASHLAPDRAP